MVISDLRAVVAGSITELAAAVHRPDTRQRWFPRIRAADHGDRNATLLRRRVALNDVTSQWTSDDGLAFLRMERAQ
jgi:hypothetical protein